MILPSYYLAPISYYARLAQCGACCIDVDEPYRKQTLRNRCWIASPNGPLSLTVPVVKFVPYRTPMRDIRISDHGNWRHLHWNALQSSYRRTPFFEFYADDFAPFYEKKWDFLVDYNQALQALVEEEIGGEWRVESGEWRVEGGEWRVESGEWREERRERNVLDLQNNSQEEEISSYLLPLTSCLQNFPPYYQLFSDRHGFMPDLSIVDLLFNMGPESILYLNDLKVPKDLKDLKVLKDPKAPNP